MKADVYTGFLTDKVKVFGTERRAKPFVLPGKVLRRVTPFLLASAMTLTACSPKQNQEEKENNGQQVDYTEIYHDVVDRYNLTELKAKEPLSQEEINELIIHTDAPELRDRNFNHCPENNANFWEIVKNGINATKAVQNSPALTYNQKKEYQITAYKMLAQISRVKGTKDEVDLSDYNNLKTFLYFEKVLRYGDNYDEVLQKSAGWIDERNEVFGRYYKDYQTLAQKAARYPGTKKFAQALYDNNERFVISYADSTEANAISKKMLQKWLQKQGFSLPTADEWAYLCGGGCRTLFPWGDGLDYSMRLRWFEDMDEDENRPYDMEEPNFFGLSIAYDPYMREVVQADRLTTCGGDGGCNICGGLGPFLGFLPCSPHCKPEVQEDNELNGDYDFYRPIIRLENHD